MCADFQVNITPAQQLQLQERLKGATTRAEKEKIYSAFMQEIGAVDKSAATGNAGELPPIKGAAVEKSATQRVQGNDLKSVSTTSTKLPAALYQDGKIPPQLVDALKDVASIGQDGTVTLKSGVTEAGFRQTLQNYLNNNAASSSLPAEVSFPDGTDEAWKQHLVEEGALTETRTGEGETATTSYKVADADKLNSLTTKIEEESGSTKDIQNLELEFITTTKTEADNIVAPKGLAHDKKARKALQGKYETKLQEWSQKNPELRDEALANMKYGKQVDKRMAKMTRGKNGLQTPTEICKKYFETYASPEEKIMRATVQTKIEKMSPQELADLYNSHKGDKEAPMTAADFTPSKDDFKQANVNNNIDAITPLVLADELGENSQSLLRKMAIRDVLDDRTKYCTEEEKQRILADDQNYFIKHMAKREVEAKVAEQNVENTTAHWNRAGKKAAESQEQNSEAMHTDIGKNGRKFVMAYPEVFGDRVADNGRLKEGVDYDYSATVHDSKNNKDVTAYFKFSNDKWDEYWDMAADTRENTIQYAKDNHLSLSEARAQMLTKDGGFNENGRRISAESTLGNGNQNVGYKELKRYRKCARTTGRPVDKDYTNLKKTGYVFGNGLKDAATAFVTAGLGDLLSKYAKVFVDVGGQTFTVIGQGKGEYHVKETKWVTTTDHYIDEFGTTDVTHQTPVDFDKEGTVDVKTSTEFTTPEGQKAGDPKSRTLKTAGGAAAIGGAMGLIRGLATMGKVQDQGTYWDGVINLDEDPKETKTTSKGSVQLVTEKPYEVRQGEYSTEKEVNKYKAVTYRGPEAYSGMYTTADGGPVDPRLFAKAYKQATGVSTMTKSFFYAIPELEINGVKFVLKGNADEEYKKIKVGVRGTTTDKAIQTPKTGEVHRGKVRRG